MIRTVDLVIAGASDTALAAAADALQHGRRVLVLVGAGDPRMGPRVRHSLRQAARASGGQVRVMTNAEVVCVDGVAGVEAVVIRSGRTSRLFAVNASAFLAADAQS